MRLPTHDGRPLPKIRLPLALALLMILTALPASAEDWIEYTDPNLGISFSYPTSWSLSPREQIKDHVGGAIILQAPGKSTGHDRLKIDIGHYFAERNPEMDLAKWSLEYDRANEFLAPGEVLELSAKLYRPMALDGKSVGDKVVFRKEGQSPVARYTYINIAHGRIVWFLWMNSHASEHQALLEKVAASVRFAASTPKQLTQIYGKSFVPAPLSPELDHGTKELQPNSLSKVSTFYKVPLLNTHSILCGSANAPHCSGTHTGSAGQAIDIDSKEGKGVYAAAHHTMYSFAYNNTGYGYHIILREGMRHVYYAHLSYIRTSVIYYGNPNIITRGTYIGRTGSTGAGGPHLHFHVRTINGGATSLNGMQGLSLYGEYPNCAKSNCAQIQAIKNEQCVCGRVN